MLKASKKSIELVKYIRCILIFACSQRKVIQLEKKVRT